MRLIFLTHTILNEKHGINDSDHVHNGTQKIEVRRDRVDKGMEMG